MHLVQIRDWCHRNKIQPIRFIYQIDLELPQICIEFNLDVEADKFVLSFPDAARLLDVSPPSMPLSDGHGSSSLSLQSLSMATGVERQG